MESSLRAQFYFAAAFEYLIYLLTKWPRFHWLDEHKTKIIIRTRLILAFFASVEITWHFDIKQHQLIVGNLTASVIIWGIYNWFGQYAMQHGFGHLIRGGNLQKFRAIVREEVKKVLTEVLKPYLPALGE